MVWNYSTCSDPVLGRNANIILFMLYSVVYSNTVKFDPCPANRKGKAKGYIPVCLYIYPYPHSLYLYPFYYYLYPIHFLYPDKGKVWLWARGVHLQLGFDKYTRLGYYVPSILQTVLAHTGVGKVSNHLANLVNKISRPNYRLPSTPLNDQSTSYICQTNQHTIPANWCYRN